MDKTIRSEAIRALLKVLRADASAIAGTAVEAERLLAERDQNGAVAELTVADAPLNRSALVFKTVMSLHRDT